MKPMFVVLALALAACSTLRNVPVASLAESQEGFTPVETPEGVVAESASTEALPNSEIVIETVVVDQPFCGEGYTQLTERSVLGTFPGECFFLFEGTIPDDSTLEVEDPGQVHQIWVLTVAQETLLPASARGSFWMIQYGWDTAEGAQAFLAAKCSQELPIASAVMRWMQEGTLQGESRSCP